MIREIKYNRMYYQLSKMIDNCTSSRIVDVTYFFHPYDVYKYFIQYISDKGDIDFNYSNIVKCTGDIKLTKKVVKKFLYEKVNRENKI